MNTYNCDFCGQPRKMPTGWHGCRQSQEAQKRLSRAVEASIGIGLGLDRKQRLVTK